MGALHGGHLSLVKLAGQHAHKVVVSIFVNPAQFAPDEDFEAYPRDEAADMARLASTGCDLVYVPRPGSMYKAHHATRIKVGRVADGLETDHRPTFFEGVALVVTKLLNRVMPDYVIFGEKDYQQLAAIRRLVEDLDMPVKVIGAPIARDEHGLALSSRNVHLDEDGLVIARQLNGIMHTCAERIRMGHEVARATAQAKTGLLAAGFSGVDYIRVADPDTLEPVLHGHVQGQPLRLLVAARCKGVRLLDNCAVRGLADAQG